MTAKVELDRAVSQQNFSRLTGALWVALAALTLVLINPRGYIGGGWDDAQYINAIISWSQYSPHVGTAHWELRWPLVLVNVAAVWLFGLGRTALMVPAILTFMGAGLALYAVVGRVAGWHAGLVAALALLTIPELGRWATIVYPDTLEILLWCVSLGCFWLGSDEQNAHSRGWLLAAGLAAGIAWELRETALGLWAVYGIAFLRRYRIPRARYGWIALAALPAPLIEYAIYWRMTGDPLYRFHVDMRHVALPSSDIVGDFAAGVRPLLNPQIMERWIGAGPIRLNWMIDPYLNLLADFMDGFVFNILALAGLALWQVRRYRKPGDQAEDSLRDLCWALVVVMAANILVNLYVLAVRPGPRMFLPALMAGSALIGIAFARLDITWLKRTIATLLVVKLILTAVIIDIAPDFTRIASMSERLVQSVSDPIHVNSATNFHMQLAPAAFRGRLTLSDTPIGGYYLEVDTPGVIVRPDQIALDPHYSWTLVSQTDTGQSPWTVRLLSKPAHALGLKDAGYPAVAARLYRRTA